MKFYIAICAILIPLAEASRIVVNVNDFYNFASSPFEVNDDNGYKVYTFNSPVDTGDILLQIKLQKKDDKTVYQEMDIEFCDDDTSTISGTLASIVRRSMGVKCPVDTGNYRGSNMYRIRGELGDDVPEETDIELLVAAYQPADGDPTQRYFSIIYTLQIQ